MGYYKLIDEVYLDGSSYSAEGTVSEMKKRGVNKDISKIIDNRVVEIILDDYYETSGAVEYGLAVVLKCKFATGDTVITSISGMKYLKWISQFSCNKGSIEGDFLFIFKGVIEELVLRNDKEHEDFLLEYNKSIEKKNISKGLDVKVGDIVNIYRESVYLGEYYYLKPNLKLDGCVAKARKYKLYAQLDKEGNYLNSEIYVESGVTSTNQPTEILGHIEVDFEKLLKKSLLHMDSIFDEGVGYRYNNNSYYSKYFANKKENSNAYILTNIQKNKNDLIEPSEDYLLSLGWLCDWPKPKNIEYMKNKNGRTIIPYWYEKK